MSMEKAIPTRPAGQSRAAVISISDDGKNLQAEPLILREEEGCFMKLTWEGILEEPPHYLLESVAELVSSTTMSKFPQILGIRLKVGKPHVAVPCPLDYLGVEITRQQRSSC
ncbi:hypothetical protein SAY87_017700 [Trapa incisa]|uniref:Uncharacterized protein n=1 Tax=Trapa incisa TaxID=236973 RepID=A0AAN7QWB6_9MYRT|nr:hypothetical protein SAY87_017700 [Trapa incisa]